MDLRHRLIAQAFAVAAGGCFFHPVGSSGVGTGTEGPETSTDSSIATTSSEPVCGNGQLEPGEQCDDGNTMDGDTCQADCTTPPGENCGNSMVDEGEECDDGNQVSMDGCENNCTETALPASCGDGVSNGDEECDDGNDINTDACTNTCEDAVCGDGLVHEGVEACDDGNDVETDDCLSTCEAASCGDGFTWEGIEFCDDGNQVDDDDCPDSCSEPGTDGEYLGCGPMGECPEGSDCQEVTGVEGNFCSPQCAMSMCPPAGAQAQAQCALISMGMGDPTHCVALCPPGDDAACPTGTTCKEVPDQPQPVGICTAP
ncbi:DUF4215 domain-containing protein [Nannocystis punicea]|uniref:DUF4215 domain-containing protein n=1 Tax=Nannocystis punicea TaxID=2995304 RepID=A0ABY7H2E8_9BACT|nr:DUF4215 domain-containing protein [Nannocystis poenicansa]WAS93433.1 DUF4215 domain-containing protein [Nannocystis poenicansa]